MSRFADKGWLETWYDHVTEQRLTEWLRQRSGSKARIDRVRKFSARARSRDALSAAVKLVDEGKDGYRFKSSPPVLVPIRDLPEASRLDDVEVAVRDAFDSYKASLTEDTRHLVGRYRMVDVALKVVGVGSVGTRCWIALLLGRHASDVLLLQVKEAVPSVLETHLPDSRFRLHGRRVVEGQRLMQASSDVFLGWSRGLDRHYYWRQLRDWKGSVDLNSAKPDGFENYARLCGYTLARAHAVSGDPAAIAGYLGSGAVFDTAVGEFSTRYAGQNLADYQAFTAAIDDGLEIATD